MAGTKKVGNLYLGVEAKPVGFEGAIGSVAKLGLALDGFKSMVQAAVGPIKDLTSAFAKQQDADVALAASLRATGQDAKGAFNDLKAYASKLQELTVVGDETTEQLMQMAINMGLTSKQAKEVAKDAIAMKAAFGVDLRAGVKSAALALQGQYEMAARYIPQLRNVKDESQKAAAFQKAMGDAFKVAEAKAGTFQGKIAQLSNSVGDLKEVMGSVLADQLLPFIKSLKQMATELNKNPKLVRNVVKALEVFAGVLATIKVTQGLTMLSSYFTSTLPAALNMSKVAALGVQGAIGLIALEVGSIAKYYLDMKAAVKEQEEIEKNTIENDKRILEEGEKAAKVINDAAKFKTLTLKEQLKYLQKYGRYVSLIALSEKDPQVKTALKERLKIIEKTIARLREQVIQQQRANEEAKRGNESSKKDKDKSDTKKRDERRGSDEEWQKAWGKARVPESDKPSTVPVDFSEVIKKINEQLKESDEKTRKWADALQQVGTQFAQIATAAESTKKKIIDMITVLLQAGLQIVGILQPQLAPFAAIGSQLVGIGGATVSGMVNSPININIHNPLLTSESSYDSIASDIATAITRHTLYATGVENG